VTQWSLVCSDCGNRQNADRLSSVCEKCGRPLLVEHAALPRDRGVLQSRPDMWRYAALLPLAANEIPISLGEGMTPLIESPELARDVGVRRLLIKDEGLNPTGSFKARGMSAAVTRARASGVNGFVVPTAGNAGAALAAYAAAAGMPAVVFAPRTTPRAILRTIETFGARLQLVDGHIGDAGKAARTFAGESGYFDVSTLKEPYRIEGKKTMGIEVAEQMEWRLPTHIVYPTGGGTGLIGMWKAFRELCSIGWIDRSAPLPKMIVAQATGCAPIVRAFSQGAEAATAWENPSTDAAGLRVPAPFGDRLILRALRESGGNAATATEQEIRDDTSRIARATGIDAAPEGGCALAVTRSLIQRGIIASDAEVLVFNTGSGASYRT
jgi:threonine synthase